VWSTVIDDLDRAIIRGLERDGRLSYRDLGNEVGLSPNATGARVARLVDEGIITGIHARVDHSLIGRPLEGYVDCWLTSREAERWAEFEAYVLNDDRIIDAVHLTGKVDYRLRVVVSSPTELDELLMALKREASISETDTRLILRRFPVAGSG
jgi:Lrp/AsnC family leucine-responsive transcriptional regulator